MKQPNRSIRVALVQVARCNTASLLAMLQRIGVEEVDVVCSTSGAQPVMKCSSPREEHRSHRYLKTDHDYAGYSHVIVCSEASFFEAMQAIRSKGNALGAALCERVKANHPTMFIGAAMHTLAGASASHRTMPGLSVLQGTLVQPFSEGRCMPHHTWNKVIPGQGCKYLFRLAAHLSPVCFYLNGSSTPSWARPTKLSVCSASFACFKSSERIGAVPIGWGAALSQYEGNPFVAALEKENVLALQFHPEASGAWGSEVVRRWIVGSHPLPLSHSTICTTNALWWPSKQLTCGAGAAAAPKPTATETAVHLQCGTGVPLARPDTEAGPSTFRTHRILSLIRVGYEKGRAICCNDKEESGESEGERPVPVETALDRHQFQGADEIVLQFEEGERQAVTFLDTFRALRARCSVPLTVIADTQSAASGREFLHAGADKVVVWASRAVGRPSIIRDIAATHGSHRVALAVHATVTLEDTEKGQTSSLRLAGCNCSSCEGDLVLCLSCSGESCLAAAVTGAGEILVTVSQCHSDGDHDRLHDNISSHKEEGTKNEEDTLLSLEEALRPVCTAARVPVVVRVEPPAQPFPLPLLAQAVVAFSKAGASGSLVCPCSPPSVLRHTKEQLELLGAPVRPVPTVLSNRVASNIDDDGTTLSHLADGDEDITMEGTAQSKGEKLTDTINTATRSTGAKTKQTTTLTHHAVHFRRDSLFGQALVPSIDLMGGRVVQLVGGDRDNVKVQIDGDKAAVELAKRFSVAGEIAVVDLDAAMGKPSPRNTAVMREVISVAACRVGGGIRTVETARAWLNAGASKVVIGTAASLSFLKELNERERVCVALDYIAGRVLVDGWKTTTKISVLERMKELALYCKHFLLTGVEREGRMNGPDMEYICAVVQQASSSIPYTVCITAAGGITLPSHVMALDHLGVQSQVGMSLYTGKMDLATGMVAPMTTDRCDGLWPTVITDFASGRVLGLAYSNVHSVHQAIQTLSGVYFSRSRGELWIKGNTSGDTQDLVRVAMDCDRDTLLFVVRQKGSGFCHRAKKGVHDCFSGPHHRGGLRRLDTTLRLRSSRAASSQSRLPASSYTLRLFSDKELLRAKLLEEAAELAEAPDSTQAAHEAADLMYFALVACHKRGASLEQVEQVLDARSLRVSRRKGDAKIPLERRDAAAPAHLSPAEEGRERLLPEVKEEELSHLLLSTRQLHSSSHSQEAKDKIKTDRGIREHTEESLKSFVQEIKRRGVAALVEESVRRGELRVPLPISQWILGPQAMEDAFYSLEKEQQEILRRTARRIRAFAVTQRSSLQKCSMRIPGGEAGHWLQPVHRVACFAETASQLLMGTIPARVAGCPLVWVVAPRASPLLLAAAHVSSCDAVLSVGGPHALAAVVHGCGKHIPPMDLVVGVSSDPAMGLAKRCVAADAPAKTDMLVCAPSELVVLADHTATASTLAADLLAHIESLEGPTVAPQRGEGGKRREDRRTRVVVGIVTTDPTLVPRLRRELSARIKSSPLSGARIDAASAFNVLSHSAFSVLLENVWECVRVCDAMAPQRLHIQTENPEALAQRMNHYGVLFIGDSGAPVFGQYGAGPNAIVTGGGTGVRSSGGALSVLTFLRVRTWLRMSKEARENSASMVRDCEQLAAMEGMHARSVSAGLRKQGADPPRHGGSSPPGELPLPDSLKDIELSIAFPKGRLMENVLQLMREAGMEVTFTNARDLRPKVLSMPKWSIKLLKPRNVVEALHTGSRDVGFAGIDIIEELDACVEPIFDTGLDPVRVVVAAPEDMVAAHGGSLPKHKHLRIATEYERLTRKWIAANNINATLIKTYGSTEVFVPEDADCIVDNTSTGSTLRAARLAIVAEISRSSTHLAVHPTLLQTPRLLWAVQQFKMLLASALDARGMQLVEFNVPTERLEAIMAELPATRAPTVSRLWQGAGYAVRLIMHRNNVPRWLPKLQAMGGTDILVTNIRQMVL